MCTIRSALRVLLLLSIATCAARPQQPGGSPTQTRTATYRDLLARLISSDANLDFTALRLAFAESPEYSPYGSEADDYRDSLRAALARQDYARALGQADSALSIDYLDVRTHVLRAYAAEQLGDSAGAAWHRRVASGVVRSVMGSGAGTAESPYVVISIAEEYAVLAMTGYDRKGQALGLCGDRACDILETVHRQSGEARTFYFDVSLPKAWYERQLRRR